MSEIEKMYENAGITKIGNKKCTLADFLDCQNHCFISENNKCDKFSYDYPPFTVEKQLEMIKWLANNKCIEISKHFIDLKNNRKHCVSRRGLQFEESLAELVNLIWQDLTETEKAEIRRILSE